MNFKEATDALFDRVTHEELAETLGVSVASIRQARLATQALSHRSPPKRWEAAVRTLAERQVTHYRALIDELDRDLEMKRGRRDEQRAVSIAEYNDVQ